MAFSTFWKNKVIANPQFNDDKIEFKITVASFKNELEKAYAAGYLKSEDSRYYSYSSDEEPDERTKSLFTEIFGAGGTFDRIFGGEKFK